MLSSEVIPCFSWKNTKGAPTAVLLCIHGLGLHGGTYRSFGEKMARRGIATYAMDVRGFGAWQKTPPCVLNFPACLEDIKTKIEELRQEYPGLPIFLLGESLGGAIGARFAAQCKDAIDGLILCAPARTIADHKLEVLQIALKYLLHPRRNVCLQEAIFRYTPTVVALKANDPQVRTEFHAGELIHLCRFLLKTSEDLTKIDNIPVLLIQGYGDMLIKPKHSLDVFDRIQTRDKDLVMIGEAQHLIFQSAAIPHKAISIVDNWIRDHLPKRGYLRRAA